MKRQFSNADTMETRLLYRGIESNIEGPEELRPEPKRVNPFQHIEDGNKALQEARIQAALHSDATQTLVHGPIETTTETVSMEDLPAIVRQAAEASIMKNLGLLRKTATKTKNQMKR